MGPRQEKDDKIIWIKRDNDEGLISISEAVNKDTVLQLL